jgi:acetoacetate decarboxylase
MRPELAAAAAAAGFEIRATSASSFKPLLIRLSPKSTSRLPDQESAPTTTVRFGYGDAVVKEAYTGPGLLELYQHALAPLAQLPVREVVPGDPHSVRCRPPKGEVVHDYLT